MPGVTITITSPVLVAGSMTGVTDAGGVNRFPSLVPGTYTVKIELSGFQTVTRENIAVLVGQTTPVEFAMKVASVAENITVTGASPTVDTTSANVTVNLSEQLIQGTPGGRDIWALVEAKVPGLVMSRPDVGGTSGGLQGTFSARGTTSAQNTSFLNGINVGDPAAIGAAGFYYDFDAFDDIQVSTGAHDITVPTSGVFLNMITKTGGNKWNGSDDVHLPERQHAGPQRHRSDAAEVRLPPGTATRRTSCRTSTSPPADRWCRTSCASSASFRDWRVHQNVAGAELADGARSDQHHLGPGQRHLAGEPEQPHHRLLLAAALQQAEPPAQRAGDHRARLDGRRRGHVRRRPGPVELGARQEPVPRRARSA